MPEYKQKVTFSREFRVTAKDADEANDKLESLIDRVEFDGDVYCTGWHPFEDEEPEEPDTEE